MITVEVYIFLTLKLCYLKTDIKIMLFEYRLPPTAEYRGLRVTYLREAQSLEHRLVRCTFSSSVALV